MCKKLDKEMTNWHCYKGNRIQDTCKTFATSGSYDHKWTIPEAASQIKICNK